MTKQFAVAIILLSVLMVLPVISGLEDELEDKLLKKGAGDSIDCGDGYILLIRNVNPKGGEVLMELQLDDRTIDDKILRKGEAYAVEKYNEEPFWYNVVDIVDIVDIRYHDTTGDYVVLDGPHMYWMLSAHSDLIISSIPQGADILIGERYVGKTPKKIPITDFEMHSLRLELSGYEDWEGTFKFEQGEGEKEMPITLNKIQPTLTPTPLVTPTPTLAPHFNLIITSVPQGADILKDGEYVGKTPKTITITDFEMHSLRLELSGYEDEERTFKFELGEEEKEMVITLNQIQSTLITTPTPTLTLTLVPHTRSPTPLTPTPMPPTPVPHTPKPVPGFLTITFISAILCGYLILKKWHGN